MRQALRGDRHLLFGMVLDREVPERNAHHLELERRGAADAAEHDGFVPVAELTAQPGLPRYFFGAEGQHVPDELDLIAGVAAALRQERAEAVLGDVLDLAQQIGSNARRSSSRTSVHGAVRAGRDGPLRVAVVLASR